MPSHSRLPESASSAGPTADRKHILVIDDDPTIRSLLVGMLRPSYHVSVASDGSEGFYLAMEERPVVAILDIQMPNWDGLQTLRAFRAHPQLMSVPVMIFSEDASRETVMAAIHGGADDYVIKSCFSRENLMERLERLRCRAARRPSAEASAQGRTALSADTPAQTAVSVPASDDESHLQTVMDGWE